MNIAALRGKVDQAAGRLTETMPPEVPHDIIRRLIPSWQEAEFLFLEPKPWWAPSVQAELLAEDSAEAGSIRFSCINVSSARDVYDRLLRSTPCGLVLFSDSQLRECLLLLGRIGRLCRPGPAVLMIVAQEVRTMFPLFLESGVTSVLEEPVSDLQIAAWCSRVVRAGGA